MEQFDIYGGEREAIEAESAQSAGPLGELTGDLFDLGEEARHAGDARLEAFANWAHERVCLTRYQLRDAEWPEERRLPDRPRPIPGPAIDSGVTGLDLAWERINSLGGYVGPDDAIGQACSVVVNGALEIIESLGGSDPARKRAAWLALQGKMNNG